MLIKWSLFIKKLRDVLQERKGATFLQVLNNFELYRTIFSGSILIYLGLSWSIFVYLGLSLAISGYLRLFQTISGYLRLSLVASLSIMVYLGLSWSILVYLVYLCLSLSISVYISLSRLLSGYPWQYPAILGYLRVSRVIPGCQEISSISG